MPPADSESIGRRIADARARARLTQADLARAVGLERSALAKIEIGARRVTALELARIAEQTDEAFEWFVTDPPPAVISYRSGAGSSTTSSIDRLVDRVARDVELLQSLGHLHVAPLEPFDQPEDVAQAVRLAADTRSLLGLDPAGPVTDLVGPIAAFGLFAFSHDLGPDAPDAATTLLARGGVSVINSDRAVGRRRLALAHELGHYLLADEYTVDWRVGAWTDAQRTEWLIDTFARALLLPAEPLRQRWVEVTNSGPVRDVAVRIASEYRVDMSTLAARLSELSLANHEELSQVRAARTTQADIIEHDLLVAHDLAGTTLPRRYEKAVLRLYRTERISADRAADLLHGTIDEAAFPPLPPADEHEIWKFTA
jgi:Zn-dependent peptidase ImmA (M78 family)/transcriptional regulator with XRE-family HTH domain